MSLVNPVIVIPGITASELRDEYAVSPETVWSAVMNKAYDRLTLHPENLRYELIEPARIAPDSVFRLVYRHLIEELRYNLTRKPEEPVPVYPFPYDWRQPLDLVERQLERFVDEVIARTSLMRHYHRAGYPDQARVNLVGHSMGGLIIAGYLERNGSSAPVDKVATLGTPFRGSFEAPLKIITGTASLGGDDESGSREREAARLTPSLYHLLPSFPEAIETNHADIPADLYDVDAWQPGVFATLAEFIRLHGLRGRANQGKRRQWAQELLAEMLTLARAHRQRIESFRLDQADMRPEQWLCMIGVDATTRVRLKVERSERHPVFNLTGKDRQNRWGDDDLDAWQLSGDGTVPYRGAEPAFLERHQLVCLRPNDFGYWEVRDRLLTRKAGFHGMLPNLNLAHRLIISHFSGQPVRGTWSRPAPGIEKDEWQSPIRNLEFKA